MKKEFVGKLIIDSKQKTVGFELDTETKILKAETGSWIGALFSDLPATEMLIGVLADAIADKIKKPKNFEFNLSNLRGVEFFKYGITNKAIKLTLAEGEIKLTCERPKKMLEIFKSLIKEAE